MTSQLSLQDLIDEADEGWMSQLPPECSGCPERTFELRTRIVKSPFDMPGEFILTHYCEDCNSILNEGSADVVPAEREYWFMMWSQCLRVACKLPNRSPLRGIWCDMAKACGHIAMEAP